MCSGTNLLTRGEARGPYGPRPHPPRHRERAGEVARRGGTTAGAGGRTSKKPESVTLPGFSWRSEISHAETSQVKENIIGYRRRVKPRPHAGVLVAGFEPTRACAQRLERSPRLPVSPHQHLVGYEPRQSRRPRRDTPHALPPAGPQYALNGTSLGSRKRELERNHARLAAR